MTTSRFFESPNSGSCVKAAIVKKYFWAWAKVIAPRANNIAYIDLYAGKGKYDDGSKSTPILVLENALRDAQMKEKLVPIFNDINPTFAANLEEAISAIPGIESLTNKPQVSSFKVGEEIVNTLKSLKLVPTLLFIDPWGYKGLTLNLIGSVLKDWGCDCIFFFNYNRVNAAFENPKFDCHINSIFGKERADGLRVALERKKPHHRERMILTALEEALKEIRGEYVVSFKFLSEKIRKTSHFLIFTSKNVLGYNIMKAIMAEESSYKYQNVATFEYDPHQDLSGLFPPTPLDTLQQDLISRYKGKCIIVKDIYQQHNTGTPYVLSNYKEALLNLEEDGLILVDPPATKRIKRNGIPTMADAVTINF